MRTATKLGVLAVLAVQMAGCSNDPGATAVAPSPEQSISRIQEDPNVPPEVKARAQAQIEAMNRQSQVLDQAGQK